MMSKTQQPCCTCGCLPKTPCGCGCLPGKEKKTETPASPQDKQTTTARPGSK